MKLISNDNSILRESNDDAVILSQYLDDVNVYCRLMTDLISLTF